MSDEECSRYVLFESASPTEHSSFLGMAEAVAGAGKEVTLILIQDGVFWLADRSGYLGALSEKKNMRVWVDDWSMKIRGLSMAYANQSVTVCTMPDMMRQMTQTPVKTIWH